ncbi:MAG: Holliday junction branch migration protein RuvA [Deltaproteobacteria bacterium]|jgi:Holliday junction DNA helicase RuvA|nr:Holliday junction branch migration protein RuvA [Deltaproteobacteria bacterium]
MIDRLRGALLEKTAGKVVVEVGGLGLSLMTPVPTYMKLPQPPAEVTLFTRMVVREESWDLFGFSTRLERETFDVLTAVPRVGPRLALTVISAMEPDELALALATQDLARLSAVKGIGTKTAERLLVELKDKAPRLADLGRIQTGGAPATPLKEEVTQALINLGYSRPEAEKALRPALLKLGPEADLGALVREALKGLSA